MTTILVRNITDFLWSQNQNRLLDSVFCANFLVCFDWLYEIKRDDVMNNSLSKYWLDVFHSNFCSVNRFWVIRKLWIQKQLLLLGDSVALCACRFCWSFVLFLFLSVSRTQTVTIKQTHWLSDGHNSQKERRKKTIRALQTTKHKSKCQQFNFTALTNETIWNEMENEYVK